MLRLHIVFAFLLVFSNQKIAACGYSFVGDCSTNISLKINGTQDSFAVAPCAGVLKFDGFSLGNLQSLSIARAKAATWESCFNNVSGVSLYYRVYEKNFPGGAWQSVDLQEDYNTLAGPYTTRYRSANTNISLTNGLTVGKTYVLEIYFLAEVDTLGDDFLPETTLPQNNNGQNYHLTFKYGGSAAPPFVMATTKVVHVKCHGDSTGVAGVSVYGDQSGLFYQWSTGGNNFPILAQLPAGTYSVTVTGASGHAASDTIEIAQPVAPLSAQITTSSPGCSGSPGQAVATPSGGTTPYYYMWENGGQDSIETFSNSGNYTLTLADANGCNKVFSINISTEPLVSIDIEAEICFGEVYFVGAEPLTQTGFYAIELPGLNGACDTVIHIDLSVRPPLDASLEVEVVAPFACSPTDSLHLLLKIETNAQKPVFDWVFGGQTISTADTCLFPVLSDGIGMATIPFFTVTDKFICRAYSTDTIIAVPLPVPLQVEATWTHPTGGFDNGAVSLSILGGAPGYAVLWDNGATDQVLLNLGPGTYCVTVTDAHGCTATICATLETSSAGGPDVENLLKIAPNPAMPGRWVGLTLPEKFIGQEIWAEIFDLLGRRLTREKIQHNQTVAFLFLPQETAISVVFIRLATENGLTATDRLSVN